jgi:glutathionylspermidine synthase
MSVDSSIPYFALDPLPASLYRHVWRETVFTHGKLDPQIGDTLVLADFPIVLMISAWQELSTLAERLAAEVIAAETELITRTDLHRTLALPMEVKTAWHNPSKVELGTSQDIRIIRFDFHYTTDGWRISEGNTDTPGGWIEASGYAREMLKYYSGYQMTGDPPVSLARAIRTQVEPGTLVSLIHATAYSEDRWMMVYLAKLLDVAGLRSCLISPSQLRWQNGTAEIIANWQQGETGYLVRFFPAEWLPNLPHESHWDNYFKHCCIPASNPTSALLTQSKRFPLVWDKLSTPLPTWRALLPETRDLRTVNDPENGQWVFKPVFGRAGEKITLREVTPDKEWTKLVRQARRNPAEWIAQRRFQTVPVVVNESTWYPSIGVYTVNGRAAGIYGRIAAQQLINDSAKDVAVFIEI